MTRESMNRILEIQEAAMEDAEYLRLHKNYQPACDRFTIFWASLCPAQQQIIDDYLQHSTLLYHRLMELALNRAADRQL